jgi:ribosome-interacting GTPase 1
MPANLTPQYFEAEKRLRAAQSPEEKIEALQTMLAVMPKHKGTDKLHADLRRKIAKITQEAERQAATSKASFFIKKEGAGQVLLMGLPNTGKSQLLASLTEALPEVAEYPYTTKSPLIGMMKFENVQLQLVDTPPVALRDSRTWLINLARNTDLITIIVDLSFPPVEQGDTVLQELENMGILPEVPDGPVPPAGKLYKKIVLIGNKNDITGSETNRTTLYEHYNGRFTVIDVSAQTGNNLDKLRILLFHSLGVIRVHTKNPGKKVELNDPMIMKTGSTVKEAAEDVHKDFRKKLKYALVWGSGKFDGQRVSQDHVLQDNDIIELHI